MFARRAQQAARFMALLGCPSAVAGARTGLLEHADDLAFELRLRQRLHAARLVLLFFLLIVLVPAAA